MNATDHDEDCSHSQLHVHVHDAHMPTTRYDHNDDGDDHNDDDDESVS